MNRFPFVACVGVLLVATAAAATAPLRVGDWEVVRRAVFTVAASPEGKTFHFVYAEGSKLQHAQSVDGGVTWTAPRLVGTGSAPDLAVDRLDTAHLVYETDGNRRIEYRRFARGAWSPARDLTTSIPGKEARVLVPRIAVDGADHIHVIYWTLWQAEEWKPGSRTAYWRLPAGAADFEPPLLWSHSREGGNARYGTLAVDPAGDLHVFYATNNNMTHAIERRVRPRDGSWGRHDLWRGNLVTDWCIGAAVTADGVAHLTVQSKLHDGLHVFYANTRADPAARTLQHDFGPEGYETFTQLLAAPNGDLWLATGHLEHRENAPREHPGAPLNIGAWARYSAASGTWTDRTPLSPPGAINLDARRGNHPRLVLQAGQVRVFYAEQLPGEKWRHWQRRLNP